METHASVARSKPEAELDSHTVTCVVGNNNLAIYDHNGPVNVYGYDPKDDHKCSKTIIATVDYCKPHSGQKYIFMIKKPFRSVV